MKIDSKKKKRIEIKFDRKKTMEDKIVKKKPKK